MQAWLLQCHGVLMSLLSWVQQWQEHCWEVVGLLVALSGWNCCGEGGVSGLKHHLVQPQWGGSSLCSGQLSPLVELGLSGGSLAPREGAGLYCSTVRALILARSPVILCVRRVSMGQGSRPGKMFPLQLLFWARSLCKGAGIFVPWSGWCTSGSFCHGPFGEEALGWLESP